jgi:hypothetical protein
MPTKEELEAEMNRQRQEARERRKHADSFAPSVALIISVPLVIYGALSFVVLYGFSEWRRMATISAIIGVLIIIELIALKINRMKGSPISPYWIFVVLLLAIAAVLALLVKV